MDYDSIVEYLYNELIDKNNCGLTIHGAYVPNGIYCDFNVQNLKNKRTNIIIDNNIRIDDIGKCADVISVYRSDCTVAVEDLNLTIENVERIEIK